MAKILIINGAPRSGKDTFIDFVSGIKDTIRYSSIEWVKEKAKLLGWDGKKDIKGRNFLSDIKDAATRYDDKLFKETVSIINYYCYSHFEFICICIREPSEIKKIVDYCKDKNMECYAIIIKNQKAEYDAKKLNNNGDNNYMNFKYDFELENNWTLTSFQRRVINFIEINMEE